MRIQHNIMAMSAYRNYTNNVSSMQKNLEKLSSGYKINRAGDDAAGLAISEKMRAQITGLDAAQKNAKDGISLVKTAEGALQEVHDMLNRMSYLATQSANGTYDNATDRYQLQKEVDQLRTEINRIADSANFNGINLLDGSMSTADSRISTVKLETSGSAPDITYTAASGAIKWATASTASASISQVPTKSLTHLHSEGEKGSIGKFTIDLGGLQVTTGSATATVKITIGTASYTYKASAGKTVTASTIAADLVNKTVYATAGGTLKIASAGATITKGAVAYKGTTDGNKITFEAKAIAKASGTIGAVTSGSKGTTISASTTNLIPTGMDIKHNYTVSATVTGTVAFKSGFAQVGVTEYTNMKADDPKQFGQAVVELDVSKLTDGMKVSVNGVDKFLQLSSTPPKGAAASQVINLSKYASANGTITNNAANKAGVAKEIANAFAHSDTGGVEIGVNNDNDLVVAEKVNANRTSAATDEVREKMKTNSSTGFQSLFTFKNRTESNEVTGKAVMTINTSKLVDGNRIDITDETGAKTSYTITTDKANQGKEGYVYAADRSGIAKALADAITAKGGTATADGKTVSVKYDVPGGTTQAELKSTTWMTGNKGLRLQIGDTADSYNQMDVTINDCHTDSLGIADIDISNQEDAAKAIDAIKDAINYVSDVRGTLGATQNRLDHTINNLSVMQENIQDAEATIRDTDVAAEMMAYTKNNILIQSAQAMLAQANQVPQGVLQLLG